jgi:hypothetical protein
MAAIGEKHMDETNTNEEGSTQSVEDIFQENLKAHETPEQPPEDTKQVETPTPTTEELAEAKKEGSVEIDGETYTYDELRANMLRHADYTRKTQELAAERKQYEPVKTVYDFVGTLPQERQEDILKYIDNVARETRGVGTGVTSLNGQGQKAPETGTQYSDELVAEGFDPKYVEIVKKIELRAAKAEARSDQLEGVVRNLVEGQKGLVLEMKGDTEAQAAAAKIKAEFGRDVSPLDLRELSKKTNIGNMEAAWLYANKDALKGQVKTETPKKPVIPQTDSSKFVMKDTDTSEDVFQAVMAGKVDINQ